MSTANLTIRKATAEDVAAAGALYDAVVSYLAERENYPKWIPGVYPSVSTAEEGVADGDLYVCEQDGAITGLFRLNETGTPDFLEAKWGKDVPPGEYLVLHALAVDPNHYGEGIGRAAVVFCKETAREKGYQGIRMDITADNPPARTLYESEGFVYADSVLYDIPTEEGAPFDFLEWYVE